MKAIRLRCEYLKNPIGIDVKNPRLHWNCLGGTEQIAYQISFKINDDVLWKSDVIKSNKMMMVYNGPELKSRDIVIWNVTIWDESECFEVSEDAYFEMGLLNKEDFKAKWIKGDYKPKAKKKLIAPYMGKSPIREKVDYFKKEFKLTSCTKARLYITSCGLYEAYINDKRVGDFVLAPGYTDYRKRIQYQTYDVTSLLKIGDNKITIKLADGWYRGSVGAWGLWCQYGTVTKVLSQLEVFDNSNNITYINSDNTWNWSNDGEIIFADNKDGEIVDSRLNPSYRFKCKVTKNELLPVSSNNVFVKEHEEFIPELVITPSGKKLLKFSQNIAGFISFSINAVEGNYVNLKCGELLDKDGELSLKNIQLERKGRKTPLQEVHYICKEGLNTFKNTFSVFGFQYVEVDSDINIDPKDFSAIAVYSDLEETLSFESSNELLNKFVECTRWSTKNNSLDIPTDCPTRERHGWTGDAQIFFNTAGYLFNYAPFTRKYYNDLLDEQKKNGCFRQISPMGGTDFYMNTMDGSPGWSDAGVFLPYRMYKLYNDISILESNYEAMKRYTKFQMKRCHKFTLIREHVNIKSKDRKYFINYGQSYGEWAEPSDVCKFTVKNFINPHPEVSTAYASYLFGLMEEIAMLLHKDEDAKLYKKYKEGTKRAYQAYVKLPKYSLDTDRQACLVRPLYFDLLDDNQKEYAKKRLIKALDNYDWRIGTGFLSTPLILDVLENIDIDYAYKLLENEKTPGWLVMPKTGSTTIWEDWDGPNGFSGTASLNHYSKGAVCEWIFSHMCGIRVDGENHFLIKPIPGGSFLYAKTTYNSIYGNVVSGWKKEDEKYTFEITIPSNCTASVVLPNGKTYDVSSGYYEFEKI